MPTATGEKPGSRSRFVPPPLTGVEAINVPRWSGDPGLGGSESSKTGILAGLVGGIRRPRRLSSRVRSKSSLRSFKLLLQVVSWNVEQQDPQYQAMGAPPNTGRGSDHYEPTLTFIVLFVRKVASTFFLKAARLGRNC